MARYDNTRYSETLPDDYGLRDFIDFIKDIAREGKADKRLTKEERFKLARHGDIVSAVVEELEKLLVEGQPVEVQKHRQDRLWQALASTCLIASYQTENPFIERKKREGVDRAAEGTRARTRDIKEVIAAVAGPILQKYPKWKTGRIVDKAFESLVNEMLANRHRQSLKHDTIVRQVNKFRIHARLSD